MDVCLVCGHSLGPEDERCVECETSVHVMVDIVLARSKPRFMFGRLLPEEMRREPFEDHPPPAVRVPDSRDDAERPRLRRQTITAEQSNEQMNTLVEESVAIDEPPLNGSTRVSLFWDMLFCVLLNAVVMQVVLWVSPRDMDQMMRFSFIPILFVFLTFTGLYFWLFIGLFKQSLGRMVADRLMRE